MNEKKLLLNKDFLDDLDISCYPNEEEEYINYEPLDFEAENKN